MKKIYVFYCLISIVMIVLHISFLFAQKQNFDKVPFYTDHALFRASQEWSFLEVYLSIPRGELNYQRDKDAYIANFRTQVELISNDSLASQYTRDFIDRIDSLGTIKEGQSIYDLASFYLKEGEYQIRSGVFDPYHKTENWELQSLRIAPFSKDSLTMSDIQLAVKITTDTVRSKFIKNGYRITPNPRHLYGIELPVLYYYTEIYNLSPLSYHTDSTYKVIVTVLDMDKKLVKELSAKTRIRGGSSLVDVDKCYIADLLSGYYQLQIEVTDNGTGEQVTRVIPFCIYKEIDFIKKSEPGVISSSLDENPYSETDEAEIDKEFELCRYIATRDEKNRYSKLDLEGKRLFMNQFWKIRDEDLHTYENEFKSDYLEHVVYANTNFSYQDKEGWKTDRGRILLQYGMPDEIERYPSSVDTKEYQIWHYYELEGGIQFYFVDVRGFGDMRLVHSTSRNEMHDAQWERWLQ